jgi:hypothetical protein
MYNRVNGKIYFQADYMLEAPWILDSPNMGRQKMRK